jgi:hypothetical protein
MNADHIVTAMAGLGRHLNTRIPGSLLRRQDGAVAWLTGLPYPQFNCLWLERPSPSQAAVAALLDEAAGRAAPFTLYLRPGSDPSLARLAAGRGLKPHGDLPLMTLDAAAATKVVSFVPGLTIRQLRPEEGRAHTGGGGRLRRARGDVPAHP